MSSNSYNTFINIIRVELSMVGGTFCKYLWHESQIKYIFFNIDLTFLIMETITIHL